MQPETTVTVPLVGGIICWHGDVDALEQAFILCELLDA